MNVITIAVSLLLLLAPALAEAQENSPASGGKATPTSSLPKGPAFRSRGERYQVLGAVRAVSRKPNESDAGALARVSAAQGDRLDEKGGYVIYRDAAASPIAMNEAGDGATQAVAVNAGTGALAVLTGNLNVRLAPGADPAAVARDHNLVLVAAAPRILAAFFRPASVQDLVQVAARLSSDARVTSAEVDVVEHVAEPQ